jgi:hypothetical protein
MTVQQPCTSTTTASYSTYTATVTLACRDSTTALLRLVSILHRRGAVVDDLRFHSSAGQAATVTAQVSLGNTGWWTLQQSLQGLVEVVDVVGHPRLERGTGSEPQPPRWS